MNAVSTLPSVVSPSLLEELSTSTDRRLLEDLQESQNILIAAASKGLRHWILPFSGGKDSSLVTILAIELVRRGTVKNVEVDVIYSDTLMDLAPLVENAEAVIGHLAVVSSRDALPVRTHIATPPVDQRFWFKVIGMGCAPPHARSQWCTDPLKIRPAETVIRNIAGEGSTILTGVRFERALTNSLPVLTSREESECGLGAWSTREFEHPIPCLTPVAHWSTCKLWDFLMMADGLWGWPLESLSRLYGDGPATRFGCWMCGLVEDEKAITAVARNPRWAHVAALSPLRQRLLDEGRKGAWPARPSGLPPERTPLSFRKEVLSDLLALQQRLSISLISPEEITAIESYWRAVETTGNSTSEDRYPGLTA